jgi:ubiquinol-cytochrome c reductase iron-sulfur subunit
MSDETNDEKPTTAADASGSIVDRLKHPVSTGGEPRERGRTSSAREIEGEVVGSTAPDVPAGARPRRRVGRRVLTEQAQAQREAAFTTPSDDDGTHFVPVTATGADYDPAQTDPREDRFAEMQVSALFLLAALGVVVACVGFFVIDFGAHLGRTLDYVVGAGVSLSLLALGAGLCLWAKKLLPHDKAVQERHTPHSPEEEELLTEEAFFKGFGQMGIGSRKMLRRTLLAAAAVLPLPAVLFLRDLGPLPHSSLRHTGWKRGTRLVDVVTRVPIKLGDLEIGGIATVMPEGFTTTDENALAPTILIRFAPGEIRSKKEATWGESDHVAYSKICSHAGCPISLYEQQTHHLLCPCHQSTFDMADDANVIFGPAARRLPQLPIQVDGDGYFVALSDYEEPVGPSFWERGDANNNDRRPPSVEGT